MWKRAGPVRRATQETRAELAVLRTYAENQDILEPILLYRPSKCKQTKKQGSEDCLCFYFYLFISLLSAFFPVYVKIQTNVCYVHFL